MLLKLVSQLMLVSFVSGALSAQSHIIESVTEDMEQARGQEFRESKGGSENNQLTNVSEPVRAGSFAFKHWVNQKGERSELAMSRTEIGGTYWYGWSMLLPEDFDHNGSNTIVMQLAACPTPRDGKFPCGANGSYMHIQSNGRMVCGDQDRLMAYNVKFKELLDSLNIPVSWVPVPGVAHDTRGLYQRVGLEGLKFMEKGFIPTKD